MDSENFQDLMLEHFGKVLNKLDGMNSELAEVKSEIKAMKTELTEVKSEVKTMKTELTEVNQSQVRMETEFGKKLDIIYYDWRESQKQFNEEIRIELRNLGTKVEALQMESTKHDQEIKDLYLVKISKE
jgi:chromosome segregation ATPase